MKTPKWNVSKTNLGTYFTYGKGFGKEYCLKISTCTKYSARLVNASPFTVKLLFQSQCKGQYADGFADKIRSPLFGWDENRKY